MDARAQELFMRLTPPERASVCDAVVSDVARRKQALVALVFALMVAVAVVVIFVAIAGGPSSLDGYTLSAILFFIVPITGVALSIAVKAAHSDVLYALAGTGLNATEKRIVVAALRANPDVAAAVQRDMGAFLSQAARDVGAVSRRVAKGQL